MKNIDFDVLKSRLTDEEIDYQRISDITYAVATEKDQNGNLVGNGRNAGNRFESALRYSLVNACHDITDPENKSKSDIRFNGINGYNDLQVKRYQPGFAQVSTIAGYTYFSDLKKIYDNLSRKRISGKKMVSYFGKFELPPDLMMVQDNSTGKTDYYLFEIEEIAKKSRKISYEKFTTCDKIKIMDDKNEVIYEVRSGEEPQSNCLTRGVWINTKWLEENVAPIVSNVADKNLNINRLLFGY